MRVAHVAVEIVPSGGGAYVGGLVKNLATIAGAQAEAGLDVEIVTTDIRNRLPAESPKAGHRVHPVRTIGSYGSVSFAGSFVAGAARELRRLHRSRPIDVVHVHSAYASLGSIAFMLSGLPAATTFGLYSPNFSLLPGHSCNGAPTSSSDRIAANFLRAFDRTIVPSLHLVRRLHALGVDGGSVVQIPPALDPSFFRELPSKGEARRRLSLPPDVPMVLYLGNLSSWKGVHDLLRALPEVRKTLRDALLVTAWGEPYDWRGNEPASIVSLMNRLGLSTSVRQMGILSDVRLALRASDVVVAPFRCTCKVLDYPLSILEALACERPVVSTRVGGIPELLPEGERGCLVAPEDPPGLAAAIISLLEDADGAANLGERGAGWVRREFPRERVRRALDSLYDLLSETPQPGDFHPTANAG